MKRPDIDGMEAMANAATEGPWYHLTPELPMQGAKYWPIVDSLTDANPVGWAVDANKAAFFAHARQFVPEVIAYVDYLESKVQIDAWVGPGYQNARDMFDALQKASSERIAELEDNRDRLMDTLAKTQAKMERMRKYLVFVAAKGDSVAKGIVDGK